MRALEYTLRHVRQHGVSCVSDNDGVTFSPSRQRRSGKKRPLGGLLDETNDLCKSETG